MHTKLIVAPLLIILLFSLVACNIPEPSPTPDINAAYTEVALTFEARRTEEALLTPSVTPSLTPTITQTPAPATNTPEAVTPTNTIPSPTNTQSPASANQCSYISQNIPDNSSFTPGSPIAITWTLKNSGQTTWTTGYKVRFYAGNIMGGTNESPLTKEVKPEENYDVSLSLTAPTAPDTYNTIWVLTSSVENGGINFCSFNLIVKVSN